MSSDRNKETLSRMTANQSAEQRFSYRRRESLPQCTQQQQQQPFGGWKRETDNEEEENEREEMDEMKRQRKRRRRQKVVNCCKKFVAFLFSHIGLATMVVAYSIMGGFLFRQLEAPFEQAVKEKITAFKNAKIEDIWRLVQEAKMTTDAGGGGGGVREGGGKANFSAGVKRILSDFQEEVRKAVKDQGWDGKDAVDGEESTLQWSFAGALLYAVTVITTIGYGHVAPKTEWGRMVTIIYALVGIPLTFLYLSNIGNFMADCFRLFYKRICCDVLCCQQCDRKRRRERLRLRRRREMNAQLNIILGAPGSTGSHHALPLPLLPNDDDDDDCFPIHNSQPEHVYPFDCLPEKEEEEEGEEEEEDEAHSIHSTDTLALWPTQCSEEDSIDRDSSSTIPMTPLTSRVNNNNRRRSERRTDVGLLSKECFSSGNFDSSWSEDKTNEDSEEDETRHRPNDTKESQEDEDEKKTKTEEKWKGQRDGTKDTDNATQRRREKPARYHSDSQLQAIGHQMSSQTSNELQRKRGFVSKANSFKLKESKPLRFYNKSFKETKGKSVGKKNEESAKGYGGGGGGGGGGIRAHFLRSSSRWRKQWKTSMARAALNGLRHIPHSTDQALVKTVTLLRRQLQTQNGCSRRHADDDGRQQQQQQQQRRRGRGRRRPAVFSRSVESVLLRSGGGALTTCMKATGTGSTESFVTAESSSSVSDEKASIAPGSDDDDDDGGGRPASFAPPFSISEPDFSQLDFRSSRRSSYSPRIPSNRIYAKTAAAAAAAAAAAEEMSYAVDQQIRLMDDPFDYEAEEKCDEKVTVPISICLVVIGGYIVAGSALFTIWEGWDYLTGSYFCFITLSTIGFGDIVPGTDMQKWASHEKLVLCALWLAFGLSLLAMCFNLMQEEVKEKCKWIGQKLGILNDENQP